MSHDKRFTVTASPFYKVSGEHRPHISSDVRLGDVVTVGRLSTPAADGDYLARVERTGRLQHISARCLTREGDPVGSPKVSAEALRRALVALGLEAEKAQAAVQVARAIEPNL